MASSIGPGGNAFLINQQLAKGPDASKAESLRQAGGTAATQRRTSAPKAKGAGEEGGVQLSEAASKSLQASHADHIQGHEHELAQQAGLQEDDPDSNEAHETRVKRGAERDQQEKAEADKAGIKVPMGHLVVTSSQGVEQVLDPDQISELTALDNNAEHVYNKVLGDIPEASLEAADRILDTQMKDGMTKVAKLKPVPEAQDAGRMELKGADFVSGPLDIREPGNDRSLPLSLDFPDPAEAQV